MVNTVRYFLVLCVAAAFAPLAANLIHTAPIKQHKQHKQQQDTFPGWPKTFENRSLTQLPLTSLEERFQKEFPGHIARFTDGNREIILRWIHQGSRRLHPASDCFKANGYALISQPLRTVGSERWSTFIASRGNENLFMSERIVDQVGNQWSDASAWYWAAQLGQSSGPWWAVTVAENILAAKP